MLCANQQMLLQTWPFLAAEPPVLVDWLPWSHTFGGNHNVNQVLVHGGTIHIDDGKPAPPLFPKTLAALREHPPTVYYNVPAGYALLVPELEDDPDQGLMFDGRLAEDFKLSSGTFVRVGALRGALVSACGGVLSDAAIAGHDEAYAGALGWLNAGEAERVCGGDAERLRAHLADALARMNSGEGSARRIERLLLLDEPPNMDAGEITDKGYVNQRAVIERRADAVARLYADPPDPDVISPALSI